MNFYPASFNLMVSEDGSYAHAARVSLRDPNATSAGLDANLFHFPVTLGSLADLNSDSDVEIIEAIGRQIETTLRSLVFYVLSCCNLGPNVLTYLSRANVLLIHFPIPHFHILISCYFYRNSYLAKEAKKPNKL